MSSIAVTSEETVSLPALMRIAGMTCVLEPGPDYLDNPYAPLWLFVAIPRDHPWAGLDPDHPMLPLEWRLVPPTRQALEMLRLGDVAAEHDWLRFSVGFEECVQPTVDIFARQAVYADASAMTREELIPYFTSGNPDVHLFAMTRLLPHVWDGPGRPSHAPPAIAEVLPLRKATLELGPQTVHFLPNGEFELLRDTEGALYLRKDPAVDPRTIARWNWTAVEKCRLPRTLGLSARDGWVALRHCDLPQFNPWAPRGQRREVFVFKRV